MIRKWWLLAVYLKVIDKLLQCSNQQRVKDNICRQTEF